MSKSEMTARFREESPVLQARIAGGFWLLCIVAGVGGFIAGGPLIVANDAAATATNILANESLFRFGFAANLISGLFFVGVTVFMYRSEERRVGKEGRSWWVPDHLKKKKTVRVALSSVLKQIEPMYVS